MRTWFVRLLAICRQFFRWFLQWQTRPAQRRWARGWKPVRPQTFRLGPKPKWVRQEVIRLKALMPQAGCRTIAHCFNRRWTVRRDMTVSKTYVADTCRRHQYLIYETRRKLKHRIPRPIPRNRTWGCDLLAKTDQYGHPHLALAIVEHASRACLRLQQLSDKSSWRLLQELVQAVKRYGRPRFVRTDHEAVLVSRVFRLGLWLLGIRRQRTEPGCPWQKLSLAEWASRAIHRHGQAGTGDRTDCGRGRIRCGIENCACLVQPRTTTRSLTGSDPGGSLGRHRCLRSAISDRDGHTQHEHAAGIELTTGRVGRNLVWRMSARIRDRHARIETDDKKQEVNPEEFRSEGTLVQMKVRH